MEKLGIMGGTFDPIHLAHIYIAEEAKRQLNLDKVLFMPAGSQPLKVNKNVTKASLRLEMVKEAIKGIDYFEVSDYEIKKKGMSYTYLTVENFKSPNRQVFFITGADCLMDLEMWNGVNRIFNACEFVVFTRPGYDEKKLKAQKMKIEEKYNKKVILIHVNSPNISSTMIREKIRDGKKVDNLLSKNVLNIIQKEGLYKE